MSNSTIQLLIILFSMGGSIISLILGITMHKKLAVKIGAIFLISIAVLVVVGYIADAPSVYTFPPSKTSMALPTGISFGIVGVCLLVLLNEIEFKVKKK